MKTKRIFLKWVNSGSVKISLSVILTCLATSAWAGVVTSIADSGAGSLRQEIIYANTDLAPTTITFSHHIAGQTIHLLSRLPVLIGPGDKITGGYAVVIDGSSVVDSAASRAVGIRVRANGITIEKLIIQNFANNGISVTPLTGASGVVINNVVIRKNRLINNLDGISISGGRGPNNSVGVLLERNRLINNQDDGIIVTGSTGNAGDGHNKVAVKIIKNFISGSLGSSTGGTISGDGVRVLGARGVGAYNHVIAIIKYNHSTGNVDDGIIVAGAGGNSASHNTVVTKIIGNTVEDNGEPTSTLGNGIVVRGGSRGGAVNYGTDNSVSFIVQNNKVNNNRDNGIILAGGAGGDKGFPLTNNRMAGSVVFNVANGNGQNGLKVTGGTGGGNSFSIVKVEGNKTTSNGGNGIQVTTLNGWYTEISNVRIVRNHSINNAANGIYVNAGQQSLNVHHTTIRGLELIKNVAKDNQANGIHLNNDLDNRVVLTRVHQNLTTGNMIDGLRLILNSVSPIIKPTPITANHSDNNGNHGILLVHRYANNDFLIKNNLAYNNAQLGIMGTVLPDGGGNIAEGNAAGCNTPGCFDGVFVP